MRDGRVERETEFFYTICYYSLYYFNELYLKIKSKM